MYFLLKFDFLSNESNDNEGFYQLSIVNGANLNVGANVEGLSITNNLYYYCFIL